MSSRVGLVGARSDWLVPRGLLGEVWVDSWLSWGGSRRLAGACSGFMQFCDSGRGFLGETRDGLWGLWPHVDTRRLAGVLLVLVRARDDSWRTCGDSWCLVETRGDSRRFVAIRGESWGFSRACAGAVSLLGESSLALPGFRSSAWCPWRVSPLSCVLLVLGRLAWRRVPS